MIGDAFMRGLAAGAWVIGCVFVLLLFGLTVYAICCAYSWAFGGEEEETTSSGAIAPPSPEGEGYKMASEVQRAKSWEEIEALYPVPGER